MHAGYTDGADRRRQREERVRKRRGNDRVWELMLTTDVCHSSLIAVTLFLALYQTHKEEEHLHYINFRS